MVGINILRTWLFHPKRASYLNMKALIRILGLGLVIHLVTSLIEVLLSFTRTGGSLGCAPGCDAGGREFETPTGPTLGFFK